MSKKLTPKQEKFVAAYVGPANGNATEAAALAGYSGDRDTLKVTGSRTLSNSNVQSKVERALAKYDTDKVIERLAQHAEADMGEFITVDQDGAFQFDLKNAKAKGLTRLIKKLKHDPETGAPVIELVDQQAALDKLAKMHGLYKDADEKANVTVNNINVRAILQAMHPAAVADFHRALLAADTVDAEPVDKP